MENNEKFVIPKELKRAFNESLKQYFGKGNIIYLRQVGEILVALEGMLPDELRIKITSYDPNLRLHVEDLAKPPIATEKTTTEGKGSNTIRTYTNYGSAPQGVLRCALGFGREVGLLDDDDARRK